MATISVARTGDRYRIAIAGRLEAKDLKRLERACSHALQHERVPLDLNVEKVTLIDASARTYLDRLRARGAHVHGRMAAAATDASLNVPVSSTSL